jgi:hypothetical protein
MSISKYDTLTEKKNNTSTQDNSFTFFTYNGKKKHFTEVHCFNLSIFNITEIISYLDTGHVTNYLILTQSSRIFVEMLIVAQLVNKFFAFMESDGLLTCSQKNPSLDSILRHLKLVHIRKPHFFKTYFNIILSFRSTCLQNGFFLSDFLTKFCKHFLPTHA